MDAPERLLLKVAHLYYVCQQRQETIAQALHLSRSTISRMLTEARERGLVVIKINYPTQTNIHVERRLEEVFGLQEAVVVPDALGLPEGVGQQVASAAATYLNRVLRPGGILGVSGGTTVAQVARALHGYGAVDLTVVQLIGQLAFGEGATALMLDDFEVTRSFAKALDARYQLLLAPAITEQWELGAALRAEPMVRQTLELARQANVAVVGIGSIGPTSHIVQAGRLTADDMSRLAAEGVVGEVCARFFDSEGRPCGATFDQRATGITLDDLRACPLVIAVAYGQHKARSIQGALRSGCLNVLITDEDTAAGVLRLAGAPLPLGEMSAV
jgi:deoxyribonucleoside regulator